MKKVGFIISCILIVLPSCKNKNSHSSDSTENLIGAEYLDSSLLAAVFAIQPDSNRMHSFSEMKKIKGSVFDMGADEIEIYPGMPTTAQAQTDEYPKHKVQISSFWIDEHEVNNAEFAAFVQATGYITTAERRVNWEMLKKQLPAGTPKPPEEDLQPAAAVFFYPSNNNESAPDFSWWKMEKGANWKHPQGKNSSIVGKENDPVVQISWYDALAYCRWAGKRLATEAEFEYAERGGLKNQMYAWGNVKADRHKANYFQGEFPYYNTKEDGYELLAPIKSFPPNGYGLYDMAGNAWEWTSDWYDAEYYATLANQMNIPINPQGPAKTNEINTPNAISKVIRGGSFLCSDSWCSGFRNSRRMRLSPDSGMEHVGFRCVKDIR